MSSHPNVILMAVFTVDGTARATMRAILAEAGAEDDDEIRLPEGQKHVYSPTKPDHEVLHAYTVS